MKTSLLGFSLIETLIVLCIVGILIAFAVPNYSNHIVHQRRLAAETALLQVAGQMEAFYAQHNTYQNATLANLKIAELTAHHSYQVVIQSQTASSYTIAAIPQGQQAQYDLRCGTLTLNSRGVKRVGGTGTLNECW